jgi:hypothetical protein
MRISRWLSGKNFNLLRANSKKTYDRYRIVACLTAFLAQFSEGQEPTVPLFKKDDGSVDRNKTLALPCYASFHLEQ